MQRKPLFVILVAPAVGLALFGIGRFGNARSATAADAPHAAASPASPGSPGSAGSAATEAEVEKLKAEVNRLQGLVPDQAAVMTHVAYHFTNLWFAAKDENWPLADFYLGEVRNNVKWAVRQADPQDQGGRS